ncbi:Lamin Tail Domain [Georgenia satyanarayanai]|uniref:Lamin Tail Domain n=1 Tax=Georgenia satyanarayanai TaxID=860221 RepID=A0A2Y9ALU3_9MICO|nr:lamin tail domain-containing protein [Georgenia satyanarayanai]PYF97860.1 lamin tail-like protein [Georgenia satyanarayanai]SSA45434.1 Lamin Tail Domain [Georgenia satyanarayanai]
MTAHHTRRAAVATTALAALTLGTLVAPVAAAPADSWPLVVTEIAPNPDSYDHFEYVEVTNPTDADVTLGDGGYTFSYAFEDTADGGNDVPLEAPAGTVVPAGGTVVLWVSYESEDGNVNSFAYDEDDFRAFWAERGGSAEAYDVVRVTGQPGLANGGNRSIRITGADGEVVGWSFYPAGSVGIDQVAQFRVPVDAATRSMDLLAGPAAASPGVVDAAQLEDRGAEEPEQPEEPVEQVPALPADSLVGNLMLTELVVDSQNVGSSDGYEYIEVYNTTTEPIDLSDYGIRYQYPDSGSSALWPVEPADAVVPSGGTVVVWVKNGANDDLTAADFNAFWGTEVPEAQILETYVGGMANGSARGMEIMTATGVTVSEGFYNMGGVRDVQTDQGLTYAADPEDFSQQTLLGSRPASPGAVDADQVPAELTAMTADTAGPRVEDTTAGSIDPEQDFTVSATITDDTLVRSVTLQLRSDVDEEFTDHNLLVGDGDTYAHTVGAVDLTGKRFYEYRFVASDGTNETVGDLTRVAVDGASTDAVRLSVTDGDVLSGTTTVSAAGDTYPADIALSIDDEVRTPTTAQLESSPVFAVEVTATDDRFRNAVVMPGEGDTLDQQCTSGRVLTIFERGTYSEIETVTAQIPLADVVQGEELTVIVSAGTKAWPCEDDNENNDDYTISAPRLILPDGRTLQPAGYEGGNIPMGDTNDSKYDNYPAVFTIPDDAYVAQGYTWDTTDVEDGTHTVSATDGEVTAAADVVVDNTAPEVTPAFTAGSRTEDRLQGRIVLDAVITDATTEVVDVVATLDGEVVELPQETSSTELSTGEHTLVVTATDTAGNVGEMTETFTTPEEDPTAELLSPLDGAEVTGPAVELVAQVADEAGDELDVVFREAYTYDATDAAVTVSSGETRDALATERDGVELDAEQRAALRAVDGESADVSSADALPYQTFDVAVPEGSGDDASVRITWDGSANASAKVLLHVWNTAEEAWEEVDRHVTTDAEEFTLTADVPTTDHLVDGTARFLVQHSEGWAGENLSDRETVVEPAHPQDTPRDEYDFTLAWESDTQYYNEEFYEHQLSIHEYLLDQREDVNLQYLFHTGDIVDNFDQPYQWANADPAYAMLDDAGLPYGVLAGNHDVGNFDSDWTAYSEHFGQWRFADNPWYGGSYEDNRGHYDLFTAGGIDFIVVSMGWDPGDAEIAWMNEVLAQYPERVGIINLHEYLLTTGGLGPIPQQIQDEVVATNPNVSMVMSGHYHDAYTRYDSFDDDGDGVEDRTVTQMLFDYQGLPEGGQGFLRLLQFDNEDEEIRVRTYSPSLEVYNSDHESLELENQDFVISYETAGIVSRVKELSTDAFAAEVLTDTEIPAGSEQAIAKLTDVPSGAVVTASWVPADGTHSWYVTATDAHGGEVDSEVRSLTFTQAPDDSDDDGPGDGGPGDGGPGDGSDGDGGSGAGDGGSGDGDGGSGGAGSGRLPSTGAPLALAGLAVLLLLGAGAATRRLSTRA